MSIRNVSTGLKGVICQPAADGKVRRTAAPCIDPETHPETRKLLEQLSAMGHKEAEDAAQYALRTSQRKSDPFIVKKIKENIIFAKHKETYKLLTHLEDTENDNAGEALSYAIRASQRRDDKFVVGKVKEMCPETEGPKDKDVDLGGEEDKDKKKYWFTTAKLDGGIGIFPGFKTEPSVEKFLVAEGWLKPSLSIYDNKQQKDRFNINAKTLWLFATGFAEDAGNQASLFTDLADSEKIGKGIFRFLETYAELEYLSLNKDYLEEPPKVPEVTRDIEKPEREDFKTVEDYKKAKGAYEKANNAYQTAMKEYFVKAKEYGKRKEAHDTKYKEALVYGLALKLGAYKFRPDGIGLADSLYDEASSIHAFAPNGGNPRSIGFSAKGFLKSGEWTLEALLNYGSSQFGQEPNEHIFGFAGQRILAGLGLIYGDPEKIQLGLRLFGMSSIGDTDDAATIAANQAQQTLFRPYATQKGLSVTAKKKFKNDEIGAEAGLAWGENLYHQDENRFHLILDYKHTFANKMALGLSLQYITSLTHYLKKENCLGLERNCDMIPYIDSNGLSKLFARFYPLTKKNKSTGEIETDENFIIEAGLATSGLRTDGDATFFSRLFSTDQKNGYVGFRLNF